MKTGFHRALSLAFAVALAGTVSGIALAQEEDGLSNPASAPRFVVLPAKPGASTVPPPVSQTTWTGTYSYKGTTYTYNMVGLAPSTGSSITVPVVIIPVKFVISTSTGTATYDPLHVLSNGKTVIANTIASPLFDMTTTYTTGGVDVGTTQYIDAFQRANFWGTVASNPGYHVLLGTPTVTAEQTLTVPKTYGTVGSEFGIKAGKVDINWFDSKAQALLTTLGIQPNQLPIFITYNSYLTQNRGCCIGGYHSAVGALAYSMATYVDKAGAFSQDVSALSHELGEWIDDPLLANINGNTTPCGILEVGDPLENTANYGDYPYSLGGFTYHLQDLATLPYFGAPTSTTVNGYTTFHGTKLTVCQNGA